MYICKSCYNTLVNPPKNEYFTYSTGNECNMCQLPTTDLLVIQKHILENTRNFCEGCYFGVARKDRLAIGFIWQHQQDHWFGVCKSCRTLVSYNKHEFNKHCKTCNKMYWFLWENKKDILFGELWVPKVDGFL